MMKPDKTPEKTIQTDLFLFYGILIMIFASPFIYLEGLYNYVILPQSAFIQICCLLLLVLVLWHNKTCKKQTAIIPHPLNTAVLLFSAWTLISCFYAHNYYEAFGQWAHWTACLVFFFLVRTVVSSEHRVFRVLGIIYAAGLITAFIGSAQYLFNISVIPQSAPPSATFANKNMAAQFITLTLPLGLVFFLGAKQKVALFFGAISASVMMVFLIYTQTRAAWLAVFVEMMLLSIILVERHLARKIILFWNRDKTIAGLTALLIILLFANIGPKGFTWQMGLIADKITSISDHLPAEPSRQAVMAVKEGVNEPGNRDESSAGLRIAIWKNTLEMIKERPILGFGMGNHKVHYPLFHNRTVKEKAFSETHQLSNVHNDFLQLFSETGVIGVAAAVGVFLIFSGTIVKICRTRNDSGFFAVLGIGAAIAGILVDSCFSFPFEMPIPPFIVMIYFALALVFLPENQTIGARPQLLVNRAEKWPVFAMVVLAALLAYSVGYYYKDIKSDRYYLQAKQFEKRGEWKSVIEASNKAYALNPNRKKILSYAARGYIETGEYKKGIDALTMVIQAYPYHMNALLNIGVAHTGLKQYDQAMKYFQQALDIKPDFSKAHINMAGIYIGLNQYEKAVDSFQKAMINDPENPMILYNMALSHIYLKAYNKAARALEKTIQVNPAWPKAQLNLAILYYQYLDRKEESVPCFQKALEQDPNVQNKDEIQKIIQMFSEKK